MNNLEKQIIGKWIDVREETKDIFSLKEFFKLPESLVKQSLLRMNEAAEGGIIEYKQNVLNSFFRNLEGAKYKSFGQETLAGLKDLSTVFLYIILIQKLIASGIIKIDKDKDDRKISADDIEINIILKDILERIKENPEYKKKIEVKNILVQFTIYKNERATLQKLAQNRKDIQDKNSALYQNFKETFTKIFHSIRKNYEIILQEDAGEFVRKNILLDVIGKKLTTILFNQAREVTTLLATLEYVLSEKYKTREILISLHEDKEKLYKLVKMEEKHYSEFCADKEKNCFSRLCLNFVKEITAIAEKYI